MKKVKVMLIVGLFGVTVFSGRIFMAEAGMPAEVNEQDHCAVCGMLVTKYPEWIARIQLSDGRVVVFDGPKDLFVYYFSPEEYGDGEMKGSEIWVKDYYTQEWLDGRKAFYVTGSDVYGPMGEEFVPLSTREAAENFRKDHHGKAIWMIEEITPDLVHDMRKGHRMKMGKQ